MEKENRTERGMWMVVAFYILQLGSHPGDLKKGQMSHLCICWQSVPGRRKSKIKCPELGVCSRDSKEVFTARKVTDIGKEVGRVRSSRALEAVV